MVGVGGGDDVLPKTTKAAAATQEQNPGVLLQAEAVGFTETPCRVPWRQAGTCGELRLDSEGMCGELRLDSPLGLADCHTPVVTSSYHLERVCSLSGANTHLSVLTSGLTKELPTFLGALSSERTSAELPAPTFTTPKGGTCVSALRGTCRKAFMWDHSVIMKKQRLMEALKVIQGTKSQVYLTDNTGWERRACGQFPCLACPGFLSPGQSPRVLWEGRDSLSIL